MSRVGWLGIGMSFLVGCASLTPAGEKVKLVNPVELTEVKKQCKEVGQTAGSSEEGKWAALIDMRNNAAKQDANVIVTSLQGEAFAGWISANILVKGIAFKCPEKIRLKLTNAEGL